MQASIVSALSIAFSTAMLFVQQGTTTQNEQQPGQRPPGQQREAGREQPAFRPAGERMQQQDAHLEQQLASWLALDNQGEIELSQFAADRTKNPEVKEFAQTMVKEHSAYADQLKPFLNPRPRSNEPGTINPRGERPATRPGANSPRPGEGADRLPQSDAQAPRGDEPAITPRRELPGTTPEGSPVVDPNRRNPGVDQANSAGRARDGQRAPAYNAMQQIAEKAAQNKVVLTKQMLEGYQGQDFDMGYLGQQIVAHTNMLATLQAMQDHGSDQFKDVVTQGIRATEKHLKHAQAIAGRLEDKESGTRSSSPRPSNTSPNTPSGTPRTTPNR